MIYTDKENLAIIQLNEDDDIIFFDVLIKVILKRPSNVIYCEVKGRIYGIITMGDIVRAGEEGRRYVEVNRKFMHISPNEYMKARKIFYEKRNINEIPVMRGDVLLGNYSRWDDSLCETNMYWGGVDKSYKYYGDVLLVKPCKAFKEKQRIFDSVTRKFDFSGLMTGYIEYSDVGEYLGSVDLILFVDEDEKRAIYTLWAYILNIDFEKTRFLTYQEFIEERWFEEMGEYLRKIKEKGVCVFNLSFERERKNREYLCTLIKSIRDRHIAIGEKENGVLHTPMQADFFDDLYTKEYVDSITHIAYLTETESGCGMLKDSHSELYNVANGERYTYEQPIDYQKKIYFIGGCYVYGHYSEDKNTIESYLQHHINEAGYKIKVVNCGSPSYSRKKDMELVLARIMTLPLRKGDIIVYGGSKFRNIDTINLLDICESAEVGAEWMIDCPWHCNHKVHLLYAQGIFDVLKNELSKTIDKRERISVNNDDYVKVLYINKYFRNFKGLMYGNIGAIVMNCNPFTCGHRYLIEQALKKADFLIIFVVEEDDSLFTFIERLTMVLDGTADLNNVLVVPSGPFILSRTTFPEYFIKEADEDVIQNVEHDITLFAERIAPYLQIRYRFVGEELEDEVTNEYNLAMKRILPQYGIELIEIPRKKLNGQYISASSVRKYLEKYDVDRLKDLVPESTQRILFRKNC